MADKMKSKEQISTCSFHTRAIDEDFDLRVKRLEEADDSSFSQDVDLEMQKKKEEEEPQPCLTVKTVVFLLTGSVLVFGAIFTIVRLRNSHYELFGDDQ